MGVFLAVPRRRVPVAGAVINDHDLHSAYVCHW